MSKDAEAAMLAAEQRLYDILDDLAQHPGPEVIDAEQRAQAALRAAKADLAAERKAGWEGTGVTATIYDNISRGMKRNGGRTGATWQSITPDGVARVALLTPPHNGLWWDATVAYHVPGGDWQIGSIPDAALALAPWWKEGI